MNQNKGSRKKKRNKLGELAFEEMEYDASGREVKIRGGN